MKLKKFRQPRTTQTEKLFLSHLRNASTAFILLLFVGLCPLVPVEAQRARVAQSVRVSAGVTAKPGQWTAGAVEKLKPGITPVVLRDVRTARQKGFDRVVFEFRGRTLPGYRIEYVDRPARQCGSGEVVSIAGDGALRVRLQPAQAHTEAGEATVKNRERRLRLGVLRELESTCDFEAEVEWVIGVSSPNRYRVLELSNPTRLIVDVKSK